MSERKRNMILLFTRNVSLELWVKSGLIEREKLIYEKFLENDYFENIFWFTYGPRDGSLSEDLIQSGRLNPSIQVIPMPLVFKTMPLGVFLYSLLMPLIHRKVFRKTLVVKTNQVDGVWTALIARFTNNNKVLVRSGYLPSQLLSNFSGVKKIKASVFKLIERIAFKNADLAFVASEHNKKYLVRNFNIKESRINVVPNFIDCDQFFPSTNSKIQDHIIFVGRLNEEKNLSNLIKAIPGTHLTLDIYGDGEKKSDLQQLAQQTKAKVNFKGTVSNSQLPNILNQFIYFILPSHFEGMPKALLEAMACGLICLGTNVEGINEVISHQQNGYLIDGTDSDSLLAGLKAFTSAANPLISENAVSTIKQHYSLNAVFEQEYALIKTLEH